MSRKKVLFNLSLLILFLSKCNFVTKHTGIVSILALNCISYDAPNCLKHVWRDLHTWFGLMSLAVAIKILLLAKD